jgi:hypothetical protein
MTIYIGLQGFSRHSLFISIITVFQFLLAGLEFSTVGRCASFLKLNSMKYTTYKNSQKELKENTTWEAFEDYLNSTYFPGASEVLDTKTIAFEYESFKRSYSI